MKKLIIGLLMAFVLAAPVCGLEIQAPEAPERVAELVPQAADSFGEGVWHLVKAAIADLDGPLREAMEGCLTAACAVLLCVVLGEVSPGLSGKTVNLVCCMTVAVTLLGRSDSLVHLGIDTAQELREYGNLLLPVMTGALAAQGGVTSSAAIYAGTALFNSVLSTLLTKLMRPMLYLFLATAIAGSVLEEDLLAKIRELIQWAMTWVLKLTLYGFSAWIAVTGAVSGSADATAVRAAKVTISTAVPVVGGILSDASELVLVSAGTLGSAAGVYGMLTVLALFSGPFVRIGLQYLLLKGVSAFCGGFCPGGGAALLGDFSSAMGMVLAMVSTQTVLLMISTLCFMKGVG